MILFSDYIDINSLFMKDLVMYNVSNINYKNRDNDMVSLVANMRMPAKVSFITNNISSKSDKLLNFFLTYIG